MIPFDLHKVITEHRQVITKNGLLVRIISTDRRDDISDEKIVALVDMGQFEEVYTYKSDGTSQSCDEDLWLYIVGKECESFINIVFDEDGNMNCQPVVWTDETEALGEAYNLRQDGHNVSTAKAVFER